MPGISTHHIASWENNVTGADEGQQNSEINYCRYAEGRGWECGCLWEKQRTPYRESFLWSEDKDSGLPERISQGLLFKNILQQKKGLEGVRKNVLRMMIWTTQASLTQRSGGRWEEGKAWGHGARASNQSKSSSRENRAPSHGVALCGFGKSLQV